MAAILSVTYTPEYQGCHRIAFRTIPDGTYCIYQDDSGSEIGVPKTTDITLDDYVDCLETLPTLLGCGAGVEVDGYVQPCCSDASTFDNTVGFTATYPAPTPCTTYTISCAESGIQTITVTDSGAGYAVDEIPNITITDLTGSGVGAVATANMRCPPLGLCDVQSITVDLTGQYYYTIDQLVVVIDAPIGGGTTATAEVTALNDCGTFTVPNCDNVDDGTIYKIIQLQGGIKFCSGGDGPTAVKYNKIQEPTTTCCDCIEYNLITLADTDVYYTDCNHTIQTVTALAGPTGTVICCTPGSIFTVTPLDSYYLFSLTEIGPCTV